MAISNYSPCRPIIFSLRFKLHRTRTFTASQHRTKDPRRPLVEPTYHYGFDAGVENLEWCQPGGYHPTHIGDEYSDEHYDVIHKLGHVYSTVWLARDHKKKQYVALKILTAGAPKESSESKIMRALYRGTPDHPGRAYVSSFLDEFTIDGPNGRHLCLVSEAAGCNLGLPKEASVIRKFQPNVARSISAQILRGLDLKIFISSSQTLASRSFEVRSATNCIAPFSLPHRIHSFMNHSAKTLMFGHWGVHSTRLSANGPYLKASWQMRIMHMQR